MKKNAAVRLAHLLGKIREKQEKAAELCIFLYLQSVVKKRGAFWRSVRKSVASLGCGSSRLPVHVVQAAHLRSQPSLEVSTKTSSLAQPCHARLPAKSSSTACVTSSTSPGQLSSTAVPSTRRVCFLFLFLPCLSYLTSRKVNTALSLSFLTVALWSDLPISAFVPLALFFTRR